MSYRIRRPKEHKELLDRLVGDLAPFQAMYEVLIFAAAFGYSRGKKIPFDATDEPIRWELFQQNTHYINDFVNMLAAASEDGREVLSDSREEARLRTFEEFANGGLEEIQSEMDRRPKLSPRDVILELVLAQQQDQDDDVSFESLVDELMD